MNDAPLNVRRFEVLQLASIFIGLIHQFAVTDGGIFAPIAQAAILVGLTMLVSRRRKNWARWVLLGFFGLGAAFMIWNAAAVLALGYPVITLTVTLMQTAALALLFTPQTARWLCADPSPA